MNIDDNFLRQIGEFSSLHSETGLGAAKVPPGFRQGCVSPSKWSRHSGTASRFFFNHHTPEFGDPLTLFPKIYDPTNRS